jgi:hypothetical protein
MATFDFLSKVYETFGFQFKLVLSTRNPAKFLGSLETWDRAEAALAEALDDRIGAGKWGLNPEDGAFYGPKVSIRGDGSDVRLISPFLMRWAVSINVPRYNSITNFLSVLIFNIRRQKVMFKSSMLKGNLLRLDMLDRL